MAFYNFRDLLGHWVKKYPKRRRVRPMCPHACCRNRRPHPEHWPLLLSAELLHTASDRDLEKGLRRMLRGDHEKAAAQIVAEIDRRDRQIRIRKQAKKSRAEAVFRRKLERQELVEAEMLRAESATSGELLNKAGKRAGYPVQSLFTGPERTAIAYASPELLDYWQTHPRPTASNLSANPRVVRRARARSDIGRVEAPRRPYPY